MPSSFDSRSSVLHGGKMLIVGTVLAIGVARSAHAQGDARIATSPVDSSAILRSVIQTEDVFLKEWRTAWLSSDLEQWTTLETTYAGRLNPRQSQMILSGRYCGRWGGLPRTIGSDVRVYRLIPSKMSLWNGLICPGWLVDDPPYPDASVVLDSALTTERRPRISKLRDELITSIADASARLRGDQWLVGQHVRFLVDQAYGDSEYFRRALQATDNCVGEKWWCSYLRGFVFARSKQLDSAQAAFDVAVRSAPDSIRCSSDNILTLLDPIAVPAEVSLPRTCSEHRVFADRYWWLADPFWGDSTNERWIEHHARAVSLLLVASLPKGETFDWKGLHAPADAIAQLAIRYGWPSRMLWSAYRQGRTGPPDKRFGQADEDTNFLPGRDPVEKAPSPPITTQEYSTDRLHFGASWGAVMEPLRASSSDWEVCPPVPERAREWWPTELVQWSRAFSPISSWQLQQWRRVDSVRVGFATQFPSDAAASSRNAAHVRTTIAGARSPTATHVIASALHTAADPVRVGGTLPFDSLVLSVEQRGQFGLPSDARVRFALVREPSLSELAGNVALSSPALLDPEQARANPPLSELDALALMLPSTNLANPNAVGLYWESYGFADRDTVEVELDVQRLDSPGVFERIAIVLGADRELAGTRVKWTDVRPGIQVSSSATTPKIHSRYLTLSTAGLKNGEYSVIVTVRKTDRTRSASAFRMFSITGRKR